MQGPGVSVSHCDVPRAFKHNRTNPALLPISVSQLAGPGGKVEYFVELANTFGWSPSEWGWQAVLAVILWCLERRGVDGVHAYVDNFFRVNPPGCSVPQRSAELRAALDGLSVEQHEEGEGTLFPALGWEIDVACEDHPQGWRMVMTCPAIKRDHYHQLFESWLVEEGLTLKEVEQAEGIAQYLAQGFPAGAAYVAPLIALQIRAVAVPPLTDAAFYGFRNG